MTHNLSLTDIALVLAAVAYAVSLLRDWRPIRALRAENSELRRTLGELEAKYADLERRYAELERSRDFAASFDLSLRALEQASSQASSEHTAIMRALEAHEVREEAAWLELQRGLASNTTALTALAAGFHAENLKQKGDAA